MSCTPFAVCLSSAMSFFLPSMTSYRGSKPFSISTARSRLGRSLICPSEALTMYCLPRYLLMVFALVGDSTITRAFAILIQKNDGGPNFPTLCCGRGAPTLLLIPVYPEPLPHFNKVLPRKLLYKPQHLQLKKRGNELGGRDICKFFKEIVQVYGAVHLQSIERLACGAVQL